MGSLKTNGRDREVPAALPIPEKFFQGWVPRRAIYPFRGARRQGKLAGRFIYKGLRYGILEQLPVVRSRRGESHPVERHLRGTHPSIGSPPATNRKLARP
jgi:hypothetical protein